MPQKAAQAVVACTQAKQGGEWLGRTIDRTVVRSFVLALMPLTIAGVHDCSVGHDGHHNRCPLGVNAKWQLPTPAASLTPCWAATHSPSPTIAWPLLSMMRWIGPVVAVQARATSSVALRRESDVWSETSRSTPISLRSERRNPSAWRRGKCKTSPTVNAVSIARSECLGWAPPRPLSFAFQSPTPPGGLLGPPSRVRSRESARRPIYGSIADRRHGLHGLAPSSPF